MPQPQHPLAFIEEIRVAQFWRTQLGDDEYSRRNPDDLFRWYEAMELRGPEEIRAYVNERMGRYPAQPITGIVSAAPHPPRDVVDLWLSTHDKARTTPYWFGFAAFLLVSFITVTNLNSCQSIQPPTAQVHWLPQAAVLATGTLTGAPATQSTLPAALQPPPSNAQPTSAAIAAQNGSSAPRSASLAASIGLSTSVQTSAFSSSSSTASTTASAASFGGVQSHSMSSTSQTNTFNAGATTGSPLQQ